MPCRYDPTPEEIERSFKNAQAREAEKTAAAEEKVTKAKTKAQKDAELINFLSVQLDYTRDLLWKVWNTGTDVTGAVDPDLASEVTKILKIQEKHRQQDLDRLVKELSKAPQKNRELLLKVLTADISKPLEPQLGFDPDSI